MERIIRAVHASAIARSNGRSPHLRVRQDHPSCQRRTLCEEVAERMPGLQTSNPESEMNHAQRIRELRDDADVFDNDARRLRHGLARHYLRSAERKREEADRMEGVTTLRVPILSMPCNVPAILLDDVQRMQSEPLPIQQLDLGL